MLPIKAIIRLLSKEVYDISLFMALINDYPFFIITILIPVNTDIQIAGNIFKRIFIYDPIKFPIL